MEYFQRFLKIFGSLIGLILLYFVVRYAVLQFQGDAALLDEVSPATLEEVIQDPSIFDALEEPMGDEAPAEEATAADDAEAAAAADEAAATAAETEAAAEEAVAEGDMAASDADEAAAAAAVDEANADKAAAATAEAEAAVDETAAEAEEEIAAAGSEEAAVEKDAEEIIAESDDELVAADSAGEADEAKAADEEATTDANDASTADESDAATMPIGGPDSVLARFHNAPIPDEYAGLVSTVEADEESIARGETTYTTLCASCHGESGMGDGPAGQALDPPAAPVAQTSHMVSDAYLFWRISEGGTEFGTAMIPWKGSLDEEARWDVINYMRSINPEAGEQGQGGQGSQGAGRTEEPLSATNHYWVLDTLYDGKGEAVELAEEGEMTAVFSDGSLSGVTACSNYAGKYEADGDALSIEISATASLADPLEGCGDAGEVDDQEEAYLEALESTASYSAQRGQMELSDEDGNVLLSFDAEPGK